MRSLPRNTILIGDALTRLRELPAASIDCVVTSPPYYQLRNYHVAGQLGLEPTVRDWVDNLQTVMSEVARVLKPTGSVWLNLGDSFSRAPRYGAPAKGLLLGPERLLIALAADGWIVRGKVIWAKPNPMPHSVGDRLNTTYEVVYHLVRAAQYFFDLNSIREPHVSTSSKKARPPIGKAPEWAGPLAGSQDGLRRARASGSPGHELGKNPGDVWTIATRAYRGAHFATFPPELVRRPILATCPEAICNACHQPWKRDVTVQRLGTVSPAKPDRYVLLYTKRWRTVRTVGGLVPCGCGASTQPGVVLDPFFGTGTVGAVACELGRDWIGIELSPDYVALAGQRLAAANRRAEMAA